MKLCVRKIVCSNGERDAVLIERATGLPLFLPNLYVTTQLRNSSKSFATILAALESIKLLYNFFEIKKIDIEYRFQAKEMLKDSEVEHLRSFISTRKESLKDEEPKVINLNSHRSKHSKLEVARQKIHKNGSAVSGRTKYNRITYIAYYLDWLAKKINERSIDSSCSKQIQKMFENILAVRPKARHQSSNTSLKSLEDSEKSALFDLLDLKNKANPFLEPAIQLRNLVIVRLLYHVGMRRGELLNLRVDDIDFTRNEINIIRRPDDRLDPRTDQPRVKTLGRKVPIKDTLEALIREYVIEYRSKIPQAKKHPYLVVTHKKGPTCGHPMGHKALDKVFSVISKHFGVKIHPHQLRHTWNDNFSELMDERGALNAQQEEDTRSYLMGWKQGSGTAQHYTKRFTQKQAHKAALKLQEQLKEHNG